MRSAIPLAAALVLASVPALAADLPAVTAPSPFVAAPVFSWTGFYGGVHAGAILEDGEASVVSTAGLGAPVLAGGVFPREVGLDGSGFIGGAQVGYNWQTGSIVLGAEADFSFVSSDTDFLFSVPGGLGTITYSAEQDWLATVRGRIGFAAGRFMPYVTGGLAMGAVETRARLFEAATGATLVVSSDDTRVGWTVGGGAEYAVTDALTLRAEYLYYDLGDDSLLIGDAVDNIVYSYETRGHIVRGGVNYRF